MKTVVVTGHKKHEIGLWNEKHSAFPYLKTAYKQKMVQVIEEGAEWFLSSGAQGLELYAAEWVLQLKEDYPQVKLAMLLPYYGQEQNWKEEAKEQYQQVLSHADYINYISKREYSHPWQLSQKNRYLIEQSDGLITFFNGVERTHPWYYIMEAKKIQEQSDYKLMIMDPEELQMLVDDLNSSW
jgi:uncharacterized phage-like protein YoqJ